MKHAKMDDLFERNQEDVEEENQPAFDSHRKGYNGLILEHCSLGLLSCVDVRLGKMSDGRV